MDNTFQQKVTMPKSDALAFEYKGMYGGAFRDVDIADFVNNPGANGVCRVFGLRLSEETLNLFASDLRSFLNDGADS